MSLSLPHLLLLSALAAVPLDAATTLDIEDGSWSSTNSSYLEGGASHYGHRQGRTSYWVTSDSARAGKKSIACRLNAKTPDGTKNRQEWDFGKYEQSKEYWYGFSYRFANDYPAPTTSPMHITQNRRGGSSGDLFVSVLEAAKPTDPLRLKVNVNYGDTIRQEFQPNFTFQRGRWHDFVINAKMNEATPGFVRIWIDGTKVFEYTGNTGLDRNHWGSIRIGQYMNDHQSQDRLVYIDNIRFGSSFAEVNPATYGGGSTPTPPNQAPVVNAGPDRTITLPATASLAGVVSDDGLPNNTISSTWSKVSGPGTVSFASTNAAATTATFSAAGTYQLRLTASDGALSASDSVQVVVQAADNGGGGDPIPSGPVTASSYQLGNPPEHTIDGDIGTRWSASGVGEWIQYDLGATVSVEAVSIAFYHGDVRRSSFDLLTSLDGSTWQSVFSGASSGASTGLERFAFAAKSARYVRIVGQGNTTNTWNSFTEVAIHQQGSGGSTPPTDPGAGLAIAAVATSADDGNVSANTIDGDLGTRWSASGVGQWARYDLGRTCEVEAVAIATYRGDIRLAIFDLQVSQDGTTWTTVWSGRSSGTSTTLETFLIPPSTARFVRILGYGNTINLWNSFTEVEIHGVPLPGGAG